MSVQAGSLDSVAKKKSEEELKNEPSYRSTDQRVRDKYTPLEVHTVKRLRDMQLGLPVVPFF